MKHIKSISILLITLLLFNTSQTKNIRVAVASHNKQKVEAVRESFIQIFPNDTIQLSSYVADSGISAQPVGKKNAELGVKNRLQDLSSKISEVDYYVAIESYIEPIPHGKFWKDIALVVVIDNQNQTQTKTLSAPTCIPSSYVQQTQNISIINQTGYSVTVGETIKQLSSYPIDSHDWHASPAFGGISRKVLIKDALVKQLH